VRGRVWRPHPAAIVAIMLEISGTPPESLDQPMLTRALNSEKVPGGD
jgi:hypothetical protein